MADAVTQSRGSSVNDDLETTLDCRLLLMLDRSGYAESTLDCCQRSLLDQCTDSESSLDCRSLSLLDRRSDTAPRATVVDCHCLIDKEQP